MRNLEILEGNKPNAFKRAGRDDDVVAIAALIDFFGGGRLALEKVTEEGGVRSIEELKAAMAKARRARDRAKETRRFII